MNLEKLQEKPPFLCCHCGNDKQGLLSLVLGKDLGNIQLVQFKNSNKIFIKCICLRALLWKR